MKKTIPLAVAIVTVQICASIVGQVQAAECVQRIGSHTVTASGAHNSASGDKCEQVDGHIKIGQQGFQTDEQRREVCFGLLEEIASPSLNDMARDTLTAQFTDVCSTWKMCQAVNQTIAEPSISAPSRAYLRGFTEQNCRRRP